MLPTPPQKRETAPPPAMSAIFLAVPLAYSRLASPFESITCLARAVATPLATVPLVHCTARECHDASCQTELEEDEEEDDDKESSGEAEDDEEEESSEDDEGSSGAEGEGEESSEDDEGSSGAEEEESSEDDEGSSGAELVHVPKRPRVRRIVDDSDGDGSSD